MMYKVVQHTGEFSIYHVEADDDQEAKSKVYTGEVTYVDGGDFECISQVEEINDN